MVGVWWTRWWKAIVYHSKAFWFRDIRYASSPPFCFPSNKSQPNASWKLTSNMKPIFVLTIWHLEQCCYCPFHLDVINTQLYTHTLLWLQPTIIASLVGGVLHNHNNGQRVDTALLVSTSVNEWCEPFKSMLQLMSAPPPQIVKKLQFSSQCNPMHVYWEINVISFNSTKCQGSFLRIAALVNLARLCRTRLAIVWILNRLFLPPKNSLTGLQGVLRF